MDFYDGIVLLPYTLISTHTFLFIFDDLINKLNVQRSSVHNLFYDGMWQRPVKGITRYGHILDLNYDSLKFIFDKIRMILLLIYYHCSNIINKCIDSAKKGFKIWSNTSLTNRMQILSKFASTLNCNGYVYNLYKYFILERFLYLFIVSCDLISAFNCL